jgi:hypothetical protein
MPDINLEYKPREAFIDFHTRTKRFAVLVCHRRAGKTESALQDIVIKALRKQWKTNLDGTPSERALVTAFPRYAYIAPYRSQAKDIVWRRLIGIVRKIPGVIINIGELSVEFPNGSQIRLYGADNPDTIKGNYLDGVILDEFGTMKPEVFSEVIRPMLLDYKGWIVFSGTPKGKNAFYTRWITALSSPDRYFTLCLPSSQSGILPKEDIEEARKDMDPEEFEQEMECSFSAAIRGSYFGKHIELLESSGRFGCFPWLPQEKVSISFDIGRADARAIWFWQVCNGLIRFIDYWEMSGTDAEEDVERLQLLPYDYETWWLPHDARHETYASKKSVMDTFAEYDAPVRKAPDPDRGAQGGHIRIHGIDAVRKFLRTYPVSFNIEFDPVSGAGGCRRGLDALRNYSRTWDKSRQVFSEEPLHDHWSNGADAFRYAALSITPTDIARSVERYRARIAKEEVGDSNPESPINTGAPTMKDLWKHHDRQNRMRGDIRDAYG